MLRRILLIGFVHIVNQYWWKTPRTDVSVKCQLLDFFLLNTVWEEWKARENCVMRCKVNLLWDWSNWNKINQLSLRCELTLWLRVDENHPWKPVSDIHIDTDISLLNGFSAVYIDMLNLCCLFVQMLNLVCQKAHSFRKLINKWGCSSIHYNLLFLCISQYLIGGKQL